MTATRGVALRAESVTLAWPGRPPTLAGATLTLPAGRRVALLGANGSGKTTLLRCLAGSHRPDHGQVTLDGVPLRHDRPALRAHRRRVQLVMQDPDDQLFSADVTQDVSFGPLNLGLDEPAVRERVAEALALLGVAHLADRATHQLSYGERKRVAMAGAVAMRPAVLILDEPTAGLDPAGVTDMDTALARLSALGTTLAVATHDADFALRWADEVAVVVERTVVQGPAVDVLADDDLLRRSRLARPWPLDLAAHLGLEGRPRTREDVIALLRGSSYRTTG